MLKFHTLFLPVIYWSISHAFETTVPSSCVITVYHLIHISGNEIMADILYIVTYIAMYLNGPSVTNNEYSKPYNTLC